MITEYIDGPYGSIRRVDREAEGFSLEEAIHKSGRWGYALHRIRAGETVYQCGGGLTTSPITVHGFHREVLGTAANFADFGAYLEVV
jgi:hypothetical protein